VKKELFPILTFIINKKINHLCKIKSICLLFKQYVMTFVIKFVDQMHSK